MDLEYAVCEGAGAAFAAPARFPLSPPARGLGHAEYAFNAVGTPGHAIGVR